MTQVCACANGFSNSGTSTTPLIKVAKKLIFVPLNDSEGNPNRITLSDVLNQAYFLALVNQADKTKRWYPMPEMLNVDDKRAASTVETFENGSKVFIQQGARDFKALLVNAPQQLVAALQSYRCDEIGVLQIDICNNMIGTLGTDQDACDPIYLYPIRLDEASIDPIFIKMTDKLSQKIELNFSYHMDENDADLRVITQDEAGYNLTNLSGLLQICADYTDIHTTGVTATLKVEGYGTPITPLTDKGLVAADFALYNVTNSASVTISTAVETPAASGIYVITHAAQTIGDEMRLTPTKTGRDYTDVVANTYQIANT
jgi:hypothetical protein